MVRWHLTSLAVLTLNTLQLAGQQSWPITTHIFMVPSLTLPSYSRANQKLSRLPFLLSPEIRTISTQPLQPTFTGDCQVCHTFDAALLDQVLVFGGFPLWGLCAFIFPWDHLFNQDDLLCILRPYKYARPQEVWMTWGKCSFLARSIDISWCCLLRGLDEGWWFILLLDELDRRLVSGVGA